MDTLYYSCHIGILLIFDCLFHYRSSTSSVTKWYDCLWTPSAIMRTSSDAKILEYLHKQDKCYTKCCTLREASCLRELVEPFNIIYEKDSVPFCWRIQHYFSSDRENRQLKKWIQWSFILDEWHTPKKNPVRKENFMPYRSEVHELLVVVLWS